MSDNIRVCGAEVWLEYSTDGGGTWAEPTDPTLRFHKTFPETPTTCVNPSLQTTSVTYTVPTVFPSGQSGSLYRVRARVSDYAGPGDTPRVSAISTSGTFYIVKPDPDVKTVILWHKGRMKSLFGMADADASGTPERT